MGYLPQDSCSKKKLHQPFATNNAGGKTGIGQSFRVLLQIPIDILPSRTADGNSYSWTAGNWGGTYGQHGEFGFLLK